MENMILNREQNSTLSSCTEPYDAVSLLLNDILLFLSFPTNVMVIVKLLIRLYKTRSFSPSAVFLLQINFANVCLFISYLLLFLDAMHVCHFSMTIFLVFFSPSLTARPLFIFSIVVLVYIAIVHPVTYRNARTLRRLEWLVVTLVWIYALAINVAIMIYEIDIFHPGFMVMFHITIPPSIFLYIADLRALISSASGNGKQTLNPAKRKAFQLILSFLIITLLYYIPRVYFLIYPLVAPMDWKRFLCSEGLVIMLLPKVSEVIMPILFLFSLRKVGI